MHLEDPDASERSEAVCGQRETLQIIPQPTVTSYWQSCEENNPPFLEIYKTSSGSHLQTVHFCEEIKLPVKAFQLPTGNLVVLYGETRPQAPNRRRYLISETTDSGQVVRTCDISKNDKTSRVSPTLSHMTLDDEGRLYVADSDNGRVIIVDRDFETCQVAAVKIDQPYRLCYVRERRMLIVGQWSPASMTLLHFSSTNDTCQHAS